MTQSKPSIAIVEDDSDQLHSIEEFLLDSGYSVWGAGSAEAFYKGFTVQPVDVVLLDLGLPGEDGLSVASLLKSRPEVGVIILSARDSLDDRLAGMRAGQIVTWSSRSTCWSWPPILTLRRADLPPGQP